MSLIQELPNELLLKIFILTDDSIEKLANCNKKLHSIYSVNQTYLYTKIFGGDKTWFRMKCKPRELRLKHAVTNGRYRQALMILSMFPRYYRYETTKLLKNCQDSRIVYCFASFKSVHEDLIIRVLKDETDEVVYGNCLDSLSATDLKRIARVIFSQIIDKNFHELLKRLLKEKLNVFSSSIRWHKSSILDSAKIEVLKVIFDVDKTLVNIFGRNFLMMTIKRFPSEIQFIEEIINVSDTDYLNHQDEYGCSALHFACDAPAANFNTIAKLVPKINVHLMDEDRLTAFDYLYEKGFSLKFDVGRIMMTKKI